MFSERTNINNEKYKLITDINEKNKIFGQINLYNNSF